jgi:hypothetical protein
MTHQVRICKSQHFQNDVDALSFKDNNFTFKQTRTLTLLIEANGNYSHLIALENENLEKPLYRLKIKGDLNVILTLEENTVPPESVVTFLRAVRLTQLEEAIEGLDINEVFIAFDFSDFWK